MLSAARRVAGILAASALLAPAAGASPGIFGGSAAPADRYPFAAQIVDDAAFACGGSLVAARYVLTAAHCVTNPVPRSIGVFVGRTTLGDPRRPDFPATAAAVDLPLDLAVLRLSAPAAVAQARLARPADAALAAPGVVATALGWGTTETSSTSPTLLEVPLTVRADSDCASQFAGYDAAVTLCAGDPLLHRDTCTGDSGGPLIVPDGVGGVILAGATLYGAERCGASYGGYAELPSPGAAAFLRAHIPQVEVSPNGSHAFSGAPVTFTASASDPDGRGPFGGYDALVWDVDGDGFDDQPGATSVTLTATAGVNSVSVLATDASGNREVRRASVVGREPSVVDLALSKLTVREGGTARLSVRKTGDGSGTIVATPSDGSARAADLSPGAGPATISFAADTPITDLQYVLGDDRRVEPNQTFVVTIGDATGDLQVGPDHRDVVTVQDDDADVALPGPGRRDVRRGAFTVPVDPNTTGRLEAVATVGRTTVAKAGRRRIGDARPRGLKLRVTAAGARRLASGEPLRARVAVTLLPAGGGLPARASRTVRVG